MFGDLRNGVPVTELNVQRIHSRREHAPGTDCKNTDGVFRDQRVGVEQYRPIANIQDGIGNIAKTEKMQETFYDNIKSYVWRRYKKVQ